MRSARDAVSACARAATHACGDKAHMRPSKMVDDLLDRFLGGGRSDRGARTCAQTFGDFQTHLDLMRRAALLQRLRICVGNHKLDAFELFVDHVIDRVATGATDAKHRDARLQVFALCTDCKVQSHFTSRRFFVEKQRPRAAFFFVVFRADAPRFCR